MVDLNATMLAMILNFAITLLLLTKFAWNPLLKILAERQARIAGQIDAADQERAAAEKLRAEYQQQMQNAKSDAQAIMDKALKQADNTKEEIIASAREEHARLLEAAEEKIARERQQALEDIRSEVVAISVAAASKIIGQSVDEKINAKLVDDFITRLDVGKQGGTPPC
ncbi:MAG: F0F1 ATP synthase subunit B [Veillonellaceae bacterium]|nr:F0F1 ATP synthase subunit B [Veillonellaceae bacterium]